MERRLTEAVSTVRSADARTPVLQLRVSSHPENGVVIFSIQMAGHTVKTFWLPIETAGGVADLLAEAAHAPVPASVVLDSDVRSMGAAAPR